MWRMKKGQTWFTYSGEDGMDQMHASLPPWSIFINDFRDRSTIVGYATPEKLFGSVTNGEQLREEYVKWRLKRI